VPVTPACNPSHSGGRDQEDQGFKSAWANSLWDPISKNPSPKRAGGVAQGVEPEFKPQYHKKIKERSKMSSMTQISLCINKKETTN
jgi:hypothetical protein